MTWYLRAGFAASAALIAATAFFGSPVRAQPASFYAEAAKPYKGATIRVLDEITPLQETLSKIVPEFEKETGIKVEWELLESFRGHQQGPGRHAVRPRLL